MNNKNDYVEFCNKNIDNIPVFFQSWWLDAVCSTDSWEVAVHRRGDNIVGVLPFIVFKNKGITCVANPHFTNRLGVYISYPAVQSYHKRLSYEKEVINGLVEQLPDFGLFKMSFQYCLQNWLPFFWKGFTQTSRYSYVIETKDKSLEEIYSGFTREARNRIRKAEKTVRLTEERSFEDFFDVCQSTYQRQGKSLTSERQLLKNLYEMCLSHNSGKIIYAVDDREMVHAAAFCVWDKERMYLLASGVKTEFKTHGTMNLIIKEFISQASDKGLIFDFEGSMIEPIEKYFRQFGARQVSYHEISRINSKLLKILLFIKDIVKK